MFSKSPGKAHRSLSPRRKTTKSQKSGYTNRSLQKPLKLNFDDSLTFLPSQFSPTKQKIPSVIKVKSQSEILNSHKQYEKDLKLIEEVSKKHLHQTSSFPKVKSIGLAHQKREDGETEMLFNSNVKGKLFWVNTQLDRLNIETQIKFSHDGCHLILYYIETGPYESSMTRDRLTDCCIFKLKEIFKSKNGNLVITLFHGISNWKHSKLPDEWKVTIYAPTYEYLKITMVIGGSKNGVIRGLKENEEVFILDDDLTEKYYPSHYENLNNMSNHKK